MRDKKFRELMYAYPAKYGASGKAADIGCNSGYGTKILSDVFDSVVGFDLNKSFIAEANKNKPANVEFVAGDILNSNIDEQFDTVVCFEVLEHIAPSNTKAFIEKLIDMAVPGGSIYISIPNKPVYDCFAYTLDHINEMNINTSLKLVDSFNKKAPIVDIKGFYKTSKTTLKLYELLNLKARIGDKQTELSPVKRTLRKAIRIVFDCLLSNGANYDYDESRIVMYELKKATEV